MVSKSHEQMYKNELRKAGFSKRTHRLAKQCFVFIFKLRFVFYFWGIVSRRLKIQLQKPYSPNKFEVFVYTAGLFCIEYLVFYHMSRPVLDVLIQYELVSDRALFKSIQLAEISVLVSFSVGVVTVCINEPKCRIPLYILALAICSYVFSKIFIGFVSPDVNFSELPEMIRKRISVLLVVLATSLFSIPVNGLLAFLIRISAGPTSKTSAAPTAPAPSDLARDLRLSRSRARRSRVGR